MAKKITTLEEDDIVLCTVKRIQGTTVFLDVHVNSHTIEGTMIFSEVSPGRIRNIREYVVPNKKIVCKVLRIQNNHPHLSLRRVTSKERDEVLEHHKKEKILEKIIKPILKDKTKMNETLAKIKSQYEPSDFLEEARENPKLLEKFFTKSQAAQLAKLLKSTKIEKDKTVKTKFKLTSSSPSGLKDIKSILDNTDKNSNIKINYLGSSKFEIKITAQTYKDANAQLENTLENIKEKTKKLNAKIEIKEAKK